VAGRPGLVHTKAGVAGTKDGAACFQMRSSPLASAIHPAGYRLERPPTRHRPGASGLPASTARLKAPSANGMPPRVICNSPPSCAYTGAAVTVAPVVRQRPARARQHAPGRTSVPSTPPASHAGPAPTV
jgi:hypothetical protein